MIRDRGVQFPLEQNGGCQEIGAEEPNGRCIVTALPNAKTMAKLKRQDKDGTSCTACSNREMATFDDKFAKFRRDQVCNFRRKFGCHKGSRDIKRRITELREHLARSFGIDRLGRRILSDINVFKLIKVKREVRDRFANGDQIQIIL